MIIDLPRGTRIGSFRAGVLCVPKKPLVWDFGTQKDGPKPFADATRNLLADPAFTAFVDAYAAPEEAPLLPVRLAAPPPPDQVPEGHMNAVRAGVVTVTFHDGHGSGFVIDPVGYVLTNAHVVREARLVTVRLVTGRRLEGDVLRVDPERDVALIRLEERGLPALPVRLVDPDVGEEVYAVGSPLSESLHTSVTRGVVSGYRDIEGQRYIQSDVNIQPGNSGGPLVDGGGNVVGISVMARMQDGIPVGLNFFIPIREALVRLNVEPEWEEGESGLRMVGE